MPGEPYERLVSAVADLIRRAGEQDKIIEDMQQRLYNQGDPVNPFSFHNALYRQSVIYAVQITGVNTTTREVSGLRVTAKTGTTWGINSLLATRPLTATVADSITIPDSGSIAQFYFLGAVQKVPYYAIFSAGGAVPSQVAMARVKVNSSDRTNVLCALYYKNATLTGTPDEDSVHVFVPTLASSAIIPQDTQFIVMKFPNGTWVGQVPVFLEFIF